MGFGYNEQTQKSIPSICRVRNLVGKTTFPRISCQEIVAVVPWKTEQRWKQVTTTTSCKTWLHFMSRLQQRPRASEGGMLLFDCLRLTPEPDICVFFYNSGFCLNRPSCGVSVYATEQCGECITDRTNGPRHENNRHLLVFGGRALPLICMWVVSGEGHQPN